ncbi:DUF5518 domain-containing protein [Halobaculum rubrum]|uniref:DUF5518 domain-containing protein n=1 Tax=Halobaculum rubrum TaxID=2872158 RepID=UPI001CA41BF6|nr:DUF5518 domain-containing protein [Halobaculum rubrum]QZY00841.1 DUF5518 domain-containing protein [Halobaculum rubrum]
MDSSNTGSLKHAAIGAAVSLVTFFLPFSPAIGGGVAGYLHGPDRTEGAKVGGLSGLLAAVPGAVLVTLVASIFVIVGPGQRSAFLVAFGVFLVALLFTVVYGGVLGAVGGFLGALLNEEFDGPVETDPARLRGDARDAESGLGPDPDPELTEFDEPIDESAGV